MITHLETDILECEVKPSLWIITMEKISGADGIPVELFHQLTDDSMKVLHSICQEIWKTHQLKQDWKISAFSPILKEGMTEECPHYHTFSPMSNGREVMLKILQSGLRQFLNNELPHVLAEFRKVWGMKDQVANIHGVIKKVRNLKKTNKQTKQNKTKQQPVSSFIPKPLAEGITKNY